MFISHASFRFGNYNKKTLYGSCGLHIRYQSVIQRTRSELRFSFCRTANSLSAQNHFKEKNTKPCMIFLRTQKLVIFLLGMREKSVRTVRGLICSLWKLAYNLLHGRPMTDVRSTITQNHVFLLFSSYSLNGGQCKHRVIMVFVLSLEHHVFFILFFIQFLQLAVEECVCRIAYF